MLPSSDDKHHWHTRPMHMDDLHDLCTILANRIDKQHCHTGYIFDVYILFTNRIHIELSDLHQPHTRPTIGITHMNLTYKTKLHWVKSIRQFPSKEFAYCVWFETWQICLCPSCLTIKQSSGCVLSWMKKRCRITAIHPVSCLFEIIRLSQPHY